MRVLTWNLFHGRARPAAGRPLLVEFARTLASLEWDVALLQEVPPWWPPALAQVARAQHRQALTSRNALLPLRAAIGRRNPDLIASNGGSCNAILARGPIGEHREAELTRRPERRVAHAISLAGGGWAVNLHASLRPPARTRADVERARAAALAWAGDEPVILGGDFNLLEPAVDGFEHAGGHFVDHVFVRGVRGGDARALDAGTLSDHRPVVVSVG
ncbi:MAG TPA: endonuclease/exonuclease/phosphatase family protein [Solirubrobacteraceae bacterium]|nr:endonuclease/exonuclease/phosphatase family protein [Solirubrobacteraceae bacterium]